MLEVDGLSVAYGAHPALTGAAVRVGPGEVVAVLGANGAGKSTLLRAVAALVPSRPSRRVRLDGRDVSRLAAHEMVEAGLALVPEGRGIFGALTVRENLELGAYPARARAEERARRAEVLALFPRLAERLGQVARTMSGGEQQMVAIGRALMSRPAVLLLDEPSLGLSPLMSRDVFAALARVREAGTAILLVEQNARRALALADRAYLLEAGRVVGEGSAASLARDPAVQRAYLGADIAESPSPAEPEPVP